MLWNRDFNISVYYICRYLKIKNKRNKPITFCLYTSREMMEGLRKRNVIRFNSCCKIHISY